MSDEFPAQVAYNTDGTAVDGAVPDVPRLAVNNRPYMGGLYNMLPSIGNGPPVRAIQRYFANGSNIDLTVNGSSTAQVFRIAPDTRTMIISGVGLLMVTSNNLVFNGSSFGGRYYSAGGLLGVGAGYYAPASLAKGLLLTVQSAGVSTDIINLTTNEDYVMAQNPPTAGALPAGGGGLVTCRFEMRQPLVVGTSDAIMWTVRDDLTNNQGIVELRSIAWGQLAAS